MLLINVWVVFVMWQAFVVGCKYVVCFFLLSVHCGYVGLSLALM